MASSLDNSGKCDQWAAGGEQKTVTSIYQTNWDDTGAVSVSVYTAAIPTS